MREEKENKSSCKDKKSTERKKSKEKKQEPEPKCKEEKKGKQSKNVKEEKLRKERKRSKEEANCKKSETSCSTASSEFVSETTSKSAKTENTVSCQTASLCNPIDLNVLCDGFSPTSSKLSTKPNKYSIVSIPCGKSSSRKNFNRTVTQSTSKSSFFGEDTQSSLESLRSSLRKVSSEVESKVYLNFN